MNELLSQLPKAMQTQVTAIKEKVQGMSPDGLAVFTRILREEILVILNGDVNSFETRVMRILTPTSNEGEFDIAA